MKSDISRENGYLSIEDDLEGKNENMEDDDA